MSRPQEAEARHVLSLSGGKDSAALAIYMRDSVPEMEYVFHDTDKELPETYDYLDRLAAILGKPIAENISCRHVRSLAGGLRWNVAIQSPPMVHQDVEA